LLLGRARAEGEHPPGRRGDPQDERSDLDIVDGKVVKKGTEQGIALAELARHLLLPRQ